MKQYVCILMMGISWASFARAQTFDVASIRPSAPGSVDASANVGLHLDGAQVRVVSFALKDYLAMAYRVKLYQVSGPDWLASQRYDISATLPAGSSPAQIPEMFQALLAERFSVKLHREKRDLPVYGLEIGKAGIKMQASPPATEAQAAEPGVAIAAAGSARGVAVNLGRGSSYTFADNRLEAKGLTMENLAGILERFLDRPVLNTTGLADKYDFAVDVTEEDYRSMLIRSAVAAGVVLPPAALRVLENGSPTSLFDGLAKLGLRLEPRKAPLEMVVVDEARKNPTEN